MLDGELFKTVVQGGSFAVVVLLVLWALFKGEPQYRALIEKIQDNHTKQVEAINNSHQLAIDRLVTEHRASIEAILRSHKATVEKLSEECRQERQEWMEQVLKEGELNRESRHDLVNKMAAIVAGQYNKLRESSEQGTGSKLHRKLEEDG